MAGKIQTAGNGQVVRDGGAASPEKTMLQFLNDHAKDYARVLPSHLSAERMTRLAISAVRTTKGLSSCTLASFASSIMACSVLGLEPNTPLGHAYLIPYKGECTLIVGYKGLIELMYRSGFVASVKVTPVFKGDEFEYEYGLHPDVRHKPSKDENRWRDDALTHVYPVVQLREKGLEPIWDVLTRQQIELRRKRSASAGSGYSPWRTDFIAMAMKTGIRSIATWVPSAVEKPSIQAAVAYENARELGQEKRAIAALGEVAGETLEDMGAFPVADDPDGPDGVAVADTTTNVDPEPRSDTNGNG